MLTSENPSRDSRSTWLKLWLAIALAVFVYRCVSTIVLVPLVFLTHPALIDTLGLLLPWKTNITLVVAMSFAVLAERWQERHLASKSIRFNTTWCVIITILAMNPLHIDVDPRLVQDPSYLLNSMEATESDVSGAWE